MSAPNDVVKQHVTRTPGVCGGKPCIAGTRIRVQDIVLMTEAGDSPDEIVAAFPHVTMADVHGALAFYFDNLEEINRLILEEQELVKKLRQETGPGPLETLRMRRGGDAQVSS